MCSVSVIQGYMQTRTVPSQWTQPMFDEYKEIIRRLEDLDTKLGEPDCVDPAKEAWMREVEARLAKLEKN